MFSVEITFDFQTVLIGPFDNQQQALVWIMDLIAVNPGEKAVISVNDGNPRTVRVFVGQQLDKNAGENLMLGVDR